MELSERLFTSETFQILTSCCWKKLVSDCIWRLGNLTYDCTEVMTYLVGDDLPLGPASGRHCCTGDE